MKLVKTCLKLIGTIVLVCVLSLTLSQSKAFAFQEYQFANNSTPILLAWAPRTLTLKGSVYIVDDEVFGDEVCNVPVNGKITLAPGKSGNLINFKECCGDEVRAELYLDASNSYDHFEVDGSAKLYEGTSCKTDDLEDDQVVNLGVDKNDSETLKINLENTGIGGGDTADFDLRFTNT
ncbi:hypothetical protein [Moorena bouillonii]|uniref:CARDB domain-containing protein n=1 Tax=Moorena bouillonii PNG TaxID=568701 RepID=A0A1U7N0Z0_9CYAN|nr:hypothetical protein [Moorena bouillonii]OLT59564.1 hypothetical protein BJP37_11525 [Moorena bouillonii PNG]